MLNIHNFLFVEAKNNERDEERDEHEHYSTEAATKTKWDWVRNNSSSGFFYICHTSQLIGRDRGSGTTTLALSIDSLPAKVSSQPGHSGHWALGQTRSGARSSVNIADRGEPEYDFNYGTPLLKGIFFKKYFYPPSLKNITSLCYRICHEMLRVAHCRCSYAVIGKVCPLAGLSPV